MKTKERLWELRQEALCVVKGYVKEQVDTWKQIPEAMKAVKSAWKSDLAYDIEIEHSVYPLGQNLQGDFDNFAYHRVYVDLETGDLVKFRKELAEDEDIIQLLSNLDQLDASKLLETLREEAVNRNCVSCDDQFKATFSSQEKCGICIDEELGHGK